MHSRFLIPLVVALSVACSSESPPPEPEPSAAPTADILIRGARIWTGVPGQPWATALAILDDKIMAIGEDADLQKLVGTATEIIGSPGGFVVPGFIDSHVHLMTSGFELTSVQLRDARTPEEFARRIGAFANTLASGEWMQGGTWDHHNWGGDLPRKEWVDELTADNPIFLVRLDGHMALANSKALELAGVDKNTADVQGGEIIRDEQGNPTGLLKDNAMFLVTDVIPSPNAAQQDAALEQAMDYLASHGVTSVQDVPYSWDDLAIFQRAHEKGKLRTRIYASVPITDWEKLADEIAENGRGDEWLRIGGLKGFMDGSLGSHTAAFFEPFDDTPGDRGFFITPPEQMQEWILGADAAKLQLLIHAIGDRANASLLEIFDKTIQRNGERDRRFRIEHAQHLRPAEIAEIARLNVIASMQPYHAIDDGRWAEQVIGKTRARYTYAFRSVLDSGAELAFGSDWSVAPAEPLLGIHAAVTRQTLDGEHPEGWVPEEKITAEEALVAYTRTAAYASFEENIKGTLAVGKLADAVILDRDITGVPPDQIPQVRVMRTIVGGRTVYQRDPTDADSHWPLPCDYASFETSPEKLNQCAGHNADGEIVIRPDLLADIDADSGVQSVFVDGNWFFASNGKTMLTLPYDNGADYFQEGLARTVQNGKIGFVNEDLDLVVEPAWDFAFPFNGGFAVVCTGCAIEPEGEHSVVTGGGWGYINSKGSVVVEPAHERDALPPPPP